MFFKSVLELIEKTHKTVTDHCCLAELQFRLNCAAEWANNTFVKVNLDEFSNYL